jgi:hypothetical protein
MQTNRSKGMPSGGEQSSDDGWPNREMECAFIFQGKYVDVCLERDTVPEKPSGKATHTLVFSVVCVIRRNVMLGPVYL